MNLLIAMPGPPEPDAAPPPELPSLTRLLSRARRLPDAPDWRAGVHRALQDAETRSLAPVALAACALPQLPQSDAAVCFVTPLHVVAGMTRVHLPPGGILLLGEREREAWRNAFNAEFVDAGVQLLAAGTGWLMTASFAHAADDAAPELLLGAALERSPAQGEAARALRRLGAEVEMWLAAHPLNDARAARQAPAVNCFWFWGGARWHSPAPFAQAPPDVSSNMEADPWLAGLASHCMARLHPGVTDLHQAMQQRAGLIVLQQSTQLPPWEHWSGLEAQWFTPAAQALRAGALQSLRLQVGRSAWRLPHAWPLRWLRRSRPWWQAVGA